MVSLVESNKKTRLPVRGGGFERLIQQSLEDEFNSEPYRDWRIEARFLTVLIIQ